MSMGHVFAETDIAHQNQIRDLAFHGAGSLLHDAVVGPGPGRHVVFLVGQSKENYGGHAQGMNLLRLFYRFIHREVEHAWHGAYLFAYPFAGANEHGINKSFRREPGFAHQATKLRRAAETAKAGDGKGHESHLATPDFSRSGAPQRPRCESPYAAGRLRPRPKPRDLRPEPSPPGGGDDSNLLGLKQARNP